MTYACLQLIIDLVDVNDNTPTFPLSQYIVHGIAETVAIGSDIMQGLYSLLNAQPLTDVELNFIVLIVVKRVDCVFRVCCGTVTATDLDSVTNSQLIYRVSDGNFTVQTLNNIGYVKTAR